MDRTIRLLHTYCEVCPDDPFADVYGKMTDEEFSRYLEGLPEESRRTLVETLERVLTPDEIAAAETVPA